MRDFKADEGVFRNEEELLASKKMRQATGWRGCTRIRHLSCLDRAKIDRYPRWRVCRKGLLGCSGNALRWETARFFRPEISELRKLRLLSAGKGGGRAEVQNVNAPSCSLERIGKIPSPSRFPSPKCAYKFFRGACLVMKLSLSPRGTGTCFHHTWDAGS